MLFYEKLFPAFAGKTFVQSFRRILQVLSRKAHRPRSAAAAPRRLRSFALSAASRAFPDGCLLGNLRGRTAGSQRLGRTDECAGKFSVDLACKRIDIESLVGEKV